MTETRFRQAFLLLLVTAISAAFVAMILGPILAALFVTAWGMFGTAFRSELAEPGSGAADPDYRSPESVPHGN